MIDGSLSPDLLTFFRLTVRNDGRKSAREIIVGYGTRGGWTQHHHIESHVEVVEETAWERAVPSTSGEGHRDCGG